MEPFLEKSFTEVLLAAPNIHVTNSAGEVEILEPKTGDVDRSGNNVRFFIAIAPDGNGSKANPYKWSPNFRADVSDHFRVIDLWYRHRDLPQVFIQIGDYILESYPTYVKAMDGHVTYLTQILDFLQEV